MSMADKRESTPMATPYTPPEFIAKPGLVESAQVLKSTIDNKLLRWFLRRFTSRCKKDGKSRLEIALRLFAGDGEACFTCSKIVKPIVARIIKRGGSAFGLSEEQLKHRFSDPYWRKGLVSVIRGIAKFGVTKPFTPGAPFLVVWDFTYCCNLRCKHCYASAGSPLEDELSTEEALDAVKKLADAGVSIIAFSGGEPLLRRDIFKILNACREYGVFTAIATNATLIDKEMAKKLKEASIGFVQISLDGATAKTHDTFRGIPGVFEKTIAGIKNCIEQGIFVEISTTGTKYNLHEIPQIVKLSDELGANWFMLYNFIPTGRGKSIIEKDLSPEEREELLKTLWRMSKDLRISILSTAPQYAKVALEAEHMTTIVPTHFYNMNLPGKLKELSEFVGGCGAGRCYTALRPNGRIDPCVFLPIEVGNIKTDDFEELWANSEVYRNLRNRDKLGGYCGSCEYRYVCGGCRARAYGYFGDYMAADPGCTLNKEHYESLVNSVLRKEVLVTVRHRR